ncbi:MAG TPA: penicillin-binding protein [Blastocatellia bacterium]|nr:penicillin-binding protein [Blastocatellia bacterium]HMX25840.1 penicillin-binding protein [Blastocatellia bacterium]HMY74277.1 penicillin-binding protein [Blastocatellia bacterium]HMZ20503.1 penicillin-binding protein [Blastocatellia bacterium]HNG31404.1 penicillin-binding protein [Blastocatellia bacterium]
MAVRTNAPAKDTRKRILAMAAVLGAWMLLIVGRLIWLQVARHEHYLERAARNQTMQAETLATRGSILDRNGKELAVSVIFNSVFVDQNLFKDDTERRKAASLLSPLLQISEAELLKKMTGNSGFVWLARRLDPEKSLTVKEVVAKNKLNAIALKPEPQRFYPNKELAAAVVGYLGESQQTTGLVVGQAGLEKSQNKHLEGKPGEIEWDRDGKNQPYARRETPALSGAQVKTTIDAALQHKVEVLADEALKMSKAKGVYAIVLDPATGEILALVNAPGFNPNDRPKSSEEEARHNRTISWPYEPGSIFKIVTYAAAFEEGKAQPDTKVNCGNGEIAIGKRIIHDTHSYGVLPAVDAFAKSSNVCAIRLATSVGKEKFFEYITNFGFGRRTGIELPAESRGIVAPPDRWNGDSLASISIGQEVSITMLQAAAAVGTIANKGTWIQPHVIKQIAGADGKTLYETKPDTRRVVSEDTARKMAELMEAVVTRGTARHAIKLNGYTAAGKTGTPQKVDPVTKRYSQTKYMPAFAGFVPATNPRFVIMVMLDEPLGAHQGGSVAAPVFNLVAQVALGDFLVQPDEKGFREALISLSNKYESKATEEDSVTGDVIAQVQPEPSPTVTPEPRTQTAPNNAKPKAPELNVSANPAPSELAARRTPPKPTPTPAPKPSGPTSVMPDVRGRGLRAVTQVCTQLNLNPKLMGSGVAFRQTPAPGARVRPGEDCKVEFQ